MSNFEAEREVAVEAFDERQKLKIDAKMVSIGLGKMYSDITVWGLDRFDLTMDDWNPTLKELEAISNEFGTTTVDISIDAGDLIVHVIGSRL